MKNGNHSYLFSGKTIGNNSDNDDEKNENKGNAYSLWIYTSSAWQGYLQKSEFLLTAWNYILPMSPSGVSRIATYRVVWIRF